MSWPGIAIVLLHCSCWSFTDRVSFHCNNRGCSRKETFNSLRERKCWSSWETMEINHDKVLLRLHCCPICICISLLNGFRLSESVNGFDTHEVDGSVWWLKNLHCAKLGLSTKTGLASIVSSRRLQSATRLSRRLGRGILLVLDIADLYFAAVYV